MVVVIGFVNGKELEVTCNKFSFSETIDGKIASYEFEGIIDNLPMYIKPDAILYIYRKDIQKEIENISEEDKQNANFENQ